jgi:cell division protein ZapA (FtsZ GTPase activity inhibitor)
MNMHELIRVHYDDPPLDLESGDARLSLGGVAIIYKLDSPLTPAQIQRDLEKRLSELESHRSEADIHKRLLFLLLDLALDLELKLGTTEPGPSQEANHTVLLAGRELRITSDSATPQEMRNAAQRANEVIEIMKTDLRAVDSVKLALYAVLLMHDLLRRARWQSVEEAAKASKSLGVRVEGRLTALRRKGQALSGRVRGDSGKELAFSLARSAIYAARGAELALDRYALLEGNIVRRGKTKIPLLRAERLIVRD